MSQSQMMTLPKPLVRVSVTWLWLVIITVLLIVSPAIVHRLFPHQYLSSYIEIVFVGLVPVLFTTFGREKWSRYGLTGQGFAKSFVWSLLFVAVSYCYSGLTTGSWKIGFYALGSSLGFPARVYYALLGIFAYGPLEMFFFIWLVINTEQVFQSKRGSFFVSLTVTAVLYGLLHAIFQGFSAVLVCVPFFVLGLIFRWTRNSIGPMIAWTWLNQQVWILASLLWSHSR
jgi:hypothetical protein